MRWTTRLPAASGSTEVTPRYHHSPCNDTERAARSTDTVRRLPSLISTNSSPASVSCSTTPVAASGDAAGTHVQQHLGNPVRGRLHHGVQR